MVSTKLPDWMFAGLMVSEGAKGEVSNHPADPGGLTKWGISQRAYPLLDIRSLTRTDALGLYQRDYWGNFWQLPEPLAYVVFDFAVNSGRKRAILTLQKLVGVTQDGAFGPATAGAARGYIDRVGIAKALADYAVARLDFLIGIGNATYIAGWKTRVARVSAEALAHA